MLKQIRPAIVSLILFTILTGVLYPAVVTGLAQLLFRHQANGSIIEKDGKPVGSSLIGQNFDDPKYFWGRLSTTGIAGVSLPYTAFYQDSHGNVAGSSGSNYGPMNPGLTDAVKARIDALRAADAADPDAAPATQPVAVVAVAPTTAPALADATPASAPAEWVPPTQKVPVDLVTASGSGLDPHISVDAALYQVKRVAKFRKLDEKVVRDLVSKHTQGRTLGVLGEPRVNVLELNLDLDGLEKQGR